MVVIRAGNNKILTRMAKKQSFPFAILLQQSDLGLRCLSKMFWQATSVLNFRTFIGKCSKFSNTFLYMFLNKMSSIRAGIHNMDVIIAKRVDPA